MLAFLKKFVSGHKPYSSTSTLPFAGYYHTYVDAPGKPVWSSREYSKFADEGYVKNVIAHRSINIIANGAASVPWVLHHMEEGGRTRVREHPLLRLLKRPNPMASGSQFFSQLYSYRLISGNAYVHGVRAENGQLGEMFMLRPDRVNVIAGAGGMPQAFRYTVGKQHRDFIVDRMSGHSDVLHIKNFHPLNDWYGLSAIEAAAYSIDQHNQAGQWNQSLLQNGARPSGALVLESGKGGETKHLSDEQYLRIKGQLDESHSGAANAGRPLLLEGGLDWKEMSMSPKDMDFINSKNSSARDIALAFGMPPQLLGIPGDNTYSNLAEARLALWEQTILPLMDSVASSLNNWLAPMFGERLELSHDRDSISALGPRREAVWNRVKNADFLTEEEKREMVGLGK